MRAPLYIMPATPEILFINQQGKDGGDGEIRTLGTLVRYAHLANECLQPLGHVSCAIVLCPIHCRFDKQISQFLTMTLKMAGIWVQPYHLQLLFVSVLFASACAACSGSKLAS
jgi:hypothetical protein